MRSTQYESRTTNHEPRITGFTLVEILAAIIILSILTSLSIVAYQKTLETNDERVCQQNQDTLRGAIEAYTIENDSLPNELAQLKPKHIHLARLKTAGRGHNNNPLAIWQALLGTRPALAATLGKFYNYDAKILRCPADKSIFDDIRKTSYKINTAVFSSDADLKNTSKANSALIYDESAYHKKALSDGETYQVGTGPTGIPGKNIYKDGGLINSTGVVIPEEGGSHGIGDIPSSTSNALLEDDCCPKPPFWKIRKIYNCRRAGFRWKDNDSCKTSNDNE